MRAFLILAASLTLLGCQSKPQIPEGALVCTEPRPEICTLHYMPACGVDKNQQMKTYSNSCAACGDKQTLYVTEGACK